MYQENKTDPICLLNDLLNVKLELMYHQMIANPMMNEELIRLARGRYSVDKPTKNRNGGMNKFNEWLAKYCN